MLSSFVSILIVAATAISASPITRQSCGTSTYGPFKLYANAQGSNDGQLVRVVDIGTDSNNNTISTMTVCDSCGQVPVYWQLNNSVLSPVFFDQVDGQKTINMPLSQGKVNFIGGSDSSLTESAIYCAKRDSSTSNGLPGLLSVNGSPDQFSVCSFVGTPGPAHRRDVYYNQIPNRVTYSCQPVHLVMQSTGFVPEPISD